MNENYPSIIQVTAKVIIVKKRQLIKYLLKQSSIVIQYQLNTKIKALPSPFIINLKQFKHYKI